MRSLILVLLLTLAGCGSSTKTREYEIAPISPVQTDRSVKENCSAGGGMGSEFRELDSRLGKLKDADVEYAKLFEAFLSHPKKQPKRESQFAREAHSKNSK